MECKLICLDIDGTLLNSQNEITENTKLRIRDASKLGIPVVLVSARMPAAMTFICEELGITDPFASYDGALIMQGEKILIDHQLPAAVSAMILQVATAFGIHVSIYRGDSWYVEFIDSWAAQEGEITHLEPAVCNLPALLHVWEEKGIGANKLLLMSEPNKIRKIKKILTGMKEIDAEMNCSKENYLEIVPKGIGKKGAVEELCKMYGISIKSVFAAGDNDNDKQMLKAVGMGVAMGNAHDSVKVCADFVTKSNDEDGVGIALEKMVLW